MSGKSYREDDLFTKLPTTTITNNIIPFFCNPLPLRNGAVGTLSVSSEGSSQLGIIDFLHLFGKTKKSFAFIGEDETIEDEPLYSVRSIFHSLMLNRKYNGLLPLLKGCQNGTISLRDAKILVEVCHTKHLTEKDESGKTALTHAGYKDLREVATYLISIGGDENEFKTGKLHRLLNKYNIGSSSNSRMVGGFGRLSNNSSTTITEQTWQTFELEVAKIYQKPILPMILKNTTLILEDLAFFIETCHLDISMKDEKGKTAIYYAGYNIQNDEIISYLLTHGGSEEDFYLGKMEKKYGIPALIKGCQFWNRKVCMTLNDAKVLIETCHVDISEKDEFGNTATYYTGCTNNNNVIDVGKYLLLHGGKEIDFNQGKADWPNAKLLIKKYEEEFPEGTPIVCACGKGRFEDVKLLITGYNDVNGSNGNNNNMTLKEYVSQVGTDSYGREYIPLEIAAEKEHFQIVKYLIEQCEADPNIADSSGWNALHYAAGNNKKDTKVIELLLTNMSLNSINQKARYGYTPLDEAYKYNESPIKQKIIDLIRSKGGKREEEL